MEITWDPETWSLRPGAEGQTWTLSYSHPSVDYLMAGAGELVRRGVLHMEWKMAWGDLRRWLDEQPERDPMVPASHFRIDKTIDSVDPMRVKAAMSVLSRSHGHPDAGRIYTPTQVLLGINDQESLGVAATSDATAAAKRYRDGYENADRRHDTDCDIYLPEVDWRRGRDQSLRAPIPPGLPAVVAG